MKRFFMLLSALLSIVIITGCHNSSNAYTGNYVLGVIETTEKENKSLIHFYDEQLNLVNSMKFPFGSMGMSFHPPVVYQDHMYVVPRGLMAQQDQTIIFSLNLKTGEDIQYDVQLPAMNPFAVSDQYVFGANWLNGIISLARFDKQTNELKTIHLEENIDNMVVAGEHLILLTCDISAGVYVSSLYQLNIHTMEIEETYDTTQYGYTRLGMAVDGNDVYFSNSTIVPDPTHYDPEEPGNTVTVFHIDTGEFDTIQLQQDYPSQLVIQDRQLFIMHSDLVLSEGKHITIYDMDTKQMEIITFDHSIHHMQISGDRLFVVELTSDYQHVLYQYQLSGNMVTLINKADPITIDDDRHYIGGIFVPK